MTSAGTGGGAATASDAAAGVSAVVGPGAAEGVLTGSVAEAPSATLVSLGSSGTGGTGKGWLEDDAGIGPVDAAADGPPAGRRVGIRPVPWA